MLKQGVHYVYWDSEGLKSFKKELLTTTLSNYIFYKYNIELDTLDKNEIDDYINKLSKSFDHLITSYYKEFQLNGRIVENIKKVLKETREEKVNKFITTNFDKIFDKFELDIELHRGMIYAKWHNSENELIMHRNNYGTLWLTDCDIYKKLRDYSKVVRLDLDSFNEMLINYLNNKYGHRFNNRLIKTVSLADAIHCLGDEPW
jgi:hypothetical protein